MLPNQAEKCLQVELWLGKCFRNELKFKRCLRYQTCLGKCLRVQLKDLKMYSRSKADVVKAG